MNYFTVYDSISAAVALWLFLIDLHWARKEKRKRRLELSEYVTAGFLWPALAFMYLFPELARKIREKWRNR